MSTCLCVCVCVCLRAVKAKRLCVPWCRAERWTSSLQQDLHQNGSRLETQLPRSCHLVSRLRTTVSALSLSLSLSLSQQDSYVSGCETISKLARHAATPIPIVTCFSASQLAMFMRQSQLVLMRLSDGWSFLHSFFLFLLNQFHITCPSRVTPRVLHCPLIYKYNRDINESGRRKRAALRVSRRQICKRYFR